MTTVDDSLRLQQTDGILSAPSTGSSSASISHGSQTAATPTSSATPTTVDIVLQNNTTSKNLYAYITGLDINKDNAVWMLQSDGSSSYYPSNPSSNGTALDTDVSIVVGAPGATRTVTIPHLAGARIWFSQDAKLTFLLNIGTDGPGLVEPSVTNDSDPNYALRWDFCEFTFNDTELFVNISYVDFVSIPVALKLESSDSTATQTVEGLPSDGLDTICTALQTQQKKDCAGWDQLVVQISTTSAGTSFLRALAPYKAMVTNSSLFSTYYDDYVDQVWSAYKSSSVSIDTQGSWGTVTGKVDSSGNLTFSGVGSFPQPSTGDIFSCSTGAFGSYSTNTDEMANIGARLAAALNRSTLLDYSSQPDGVTDASKYYQNTVTNHYARIVHATNLDGRGYAFPYDDVAPDNGADQSGSVASGSPKSLTVYIGGGNDSGATSSSTTTTRSTSSRSTPIRLRDMARPGRQLVGGRRQHHRRSLPSPPPSKEAEQQAMVPLCDDEKALLMAQDRAASDAMTMDLEKGQFSVASAKGDALSSPASKPDLTARFAMLLHQALFYLWASICSLGRSVWAMVPRPVAVPVAAFYTRIAASPAMAAVSASVSSFISSVVKSAAASAVAAMIIRPLVVRTALTLVVLVVTYAATAGGSAGASPMLTSAMASMTSWVDALVGEHPVAALE